MFRKAALAVVLAAPFLGAQAMDLPQPVRELTNKNKTTPAGRNSGAKSKAKTVDLCFRRDFYDVQFLSPTQPPPPNAFVAVVGASVFDCADVLPDGSGLINPTPTQIGIVG